MGKLMNRKTYKAKLERRTTSRINNKKNSPKQQKVHQKRINLWILFNLNVNKDPDQVTNKKIYNSY